MSPLFHIFHVVPEMRKSAGGIASVLPELAKMLRTQNVASSFVTNYLDTKNKPSFPVFPSLEEAHKIIATTKVPVIIHSHGLWSSINHQAVKYAQTYHIPYVISPHGMLLPWARNNKKLRKDIAWLLYQKQDLIKSNAVHITSQASQEHLLKAVNYPKASLIPFGIYPPTNLRVKVNSGPKTLLFLGRLHPIKNLMGLIEAFKIAKPENWTLSIVGPDSDGYKAKLNEKIRSENLSDVVEINEPVYGTQKESLLTDVDALILPSFTENFGAVISEALSFALPVIASTGTPWSVLESNNMGWWVKPEPKSLATAILDLSECSNEDLQIKGRAAQNYAYTRLSWNVAAPKFIKMYESILPQHHFSY